MTTGEVYSAQSSWKSKFIFLLKFHHKCVVVNFTSWDERIQRRQKHLNSCFRFHIKGVNLAKNSLVCCSTGNVFQRTMLCPWRVYFKPEESIPTFITNACFFLLHFQKKQGCISTQKKALILVSPCHNQKFMGEIQFFPHWASSLPSAVHWTYQTRSSHWTYHTLSIKKIRKKSLCSLNTSLKLKPQHLLLLLIWLHSSFTST